MNPTRTNRARQLLLLTIAALTLNVPIANSQDKTSTYQKGTITASDTELKDFSSIQGNADKHHVKVYELKGADQTYKISDCGAFQSGKFTAGQTVDYRVDGDRLYIRREDGKETKCSIQKPKP